MNPNNPLPASQDKRLLILFAWASIFLISDLPDVICNQIFKQVPAWFFWGKIGFLALSLVLCVFWERFRPLRPYTSVMLIFFLALAGSEQVKNSVWWAGIFREAEPSFFLAYLKPFIRDTGVALVVIAGLWMIKRQRSESFLVKGQINAPIEPVRWLGIRTGESWRTFGWIFAVIAAAGVAFPTLIAIKPSVGELLGAVRLLPAVLVFAALNAFNEEIYFRITLLSTLPQIIGKHHALLINFAFFGLAHYLYGSPPGMVGFLMTGFLAWLLGKSILETKGVFWAWFIHFLPDVVIFASYAFLWRR